MKNSNVYSTKCNLHWCIYLQLPAPLPICKECLGATAAGSNNNKQQKQSGNALASGEKLSRCSACGAALHNSCAPAELAILVERGTSWSCGDCAPTCSGCQQERESQSYLVRCGDCPNCYHPGCLDPALDKRSKAPWRCRHCLQTDCTETDNPVPNANASNASPDTPKKRFGANRENRK